ncbi:hypothetical protein BH11PSE13_BH11PSE13_23850 [soil metagenome]
MLDYVFDLSALAQLAIAFAYGAVVFGTSCVLLDFLHARYAVHPKLLPVGPAFQVLTVLFALLLGFLAADIWSQQRQAVEAVFKEEISVQRLVDLSGSAALDDAAARPLIEQYRTAVADREWGAHFNRIADVSASTALLSLRLLGAKMAQGGKPPVLTADWMRSVNDLEEARHRRLLIGADTTDNSQWSVVLVLTFFAAAALAACHMDRPPAGRLVLLLFSIGVSIVLWQLARHTNPYNGGDIQIRMPRPPT